MPPRRKKGGVLLRQTNSANYEIVMVGLNGAMARHAYTLETALEVAYDFAESHYVREINIRCNGVLIASYVPE